MRWAGVLYRSPGLSPQNADVRFAAALARLRAGEGAEARALLRPLAPHSPMAVDDLAPRIGAALDAGKPPREALAIAWEKKADVTD